MTWLFLSILYKKNYGIVLCASMSTKTFDTDYDYSEDLGPLVGYPVI